MFNKPHVAVPTDLGKPSRAIATITDEVLGLRPPTSSLCLAVVQERLRVREAELAEIDTAMEQARMEGFAAAVRLMSLDAPDPVVFNVFTEISGGAKEAP